MPDNSNSSLFRLEVDYSEAEQGIDDLTEKFSDFSERVAGFLTAVERRTSAGFSNLGSNIQDGLSKVDLSAIDQGMANAETRAQNLQQTLMQLIAAELATVQSSAQLANQFLDAAQAGEQTLDSFMQMVRATGALSSAQSENLVEVLNTVDVLGTLLQELNRTGASEEEVKEKTQALTAVLQAQVAAFRGTNEATTEAVQGMLNFAQAAESETPEDEIEDLNAALLESARHYYAVLDAHKAAMAAEDTEASKRLAIDRNEAWKRYNELIEKTGRSIPSVFAEIRAEAEKTEKATEELADVEPLAATITREAISGWEDLSEEIKKAARAYVAYEEKISKGGSLRPGEIPMGQQRYATTLMNRLSETVGGDTQILATAVRGAQMEFDGLGKKAEAAEEKLEAVKDTIEAIKEEAQEIPQVELAPQEMKLDLGGTNALLDDMLESVGAKVDLDEIVQNEEVATEKIEEVEEALVELKEEAQATDAVDTSELLKNVQQLGQEAENTGEKLSESLDAMGVPSFEELVAEWDAVDEAAEDAAENIKEVDDATDSAAAAAERLDAEQKALEQADVTKPIEELKSDTDQAQEKTEELLRQMREAADIDWVPDDVGHNIAAYDAWAESVREAKQEKQAFNEVAATPPPPPPPPPPPSTPPIGPDDEDPLRRIVELLEQIANKFSELRAEGGLTLVTEDALNRLREANAELENAAKVREFFNSLPDASTATALPNVSEASEAAQETAEALQDVADEGEEAVDVLKSLGNEAENVPTEGFDEAEDEIAILKNTSKESEQTISELIDMFALMGTEAPQGFSVLSRAISNTRSTTSDLENAWALLISQMPEARQALVDLANRTGGLNISVSETGQIMGTAGRQIGSFANQAAQVQQPTQATTQALNIQNSALASLLQRFPQLQSLLQRLASRFGNFTVSVNQASNATNNLNNSANQALGGSGPLSAFKLGGIIAGMDRLLDSVINLAERGFDRLLESIRDAFEMAKEFDSIEASFGGLIQGAFGAENIDPAVQGLTDKLSRALAAQGREYAEQLGIDVTDTFRRILPKVGDLATTEAFLRALPGLRAAAPDLPAKRAGLAEQELIAGDYQPVRRAFELPVGRLQAAINEGATAIELAEALNTTLEELGLGFEQQSETLLVQLGQIKQQFVTLQSIAGINILEGLEAELPRLKQLLAENEDQFRQLTVNIGTLFREVIAAGGDIAAALLEGGVIEGIAKIVEEVTIWFNRMQALLAISAQARDFFKRISDEAREGLQNITKYFGGIEESLSKFILPVKIGKYIRDIFLEAAKPFTDFIDGVKEGGDVFTGVMDTFVRKITETNAKFFLFFTAGATFASLIDEIATGAISVSDALQIAKEAGADAYIETIESGEQILADFNTQLEENATLSEETAASILDVGDAATELAAALVTVQSSLGQLDELMAERNAIIEKYDEEYAEEARKFFFDQEKLNREHLRRIVEDQIDAAQKRVDLETDLNRDLYNISLKGSQKRQDVYKEFGRDIDDLATDLSREFEDLETEIGRDAEDAAIDRAQKLEDIELESSDKRLEIEQAYRDKLLDIQRQYDFDAEEAIRQNDAVALLRLRRRTQKQLEDARIERDRRLRDVEEDKQKEVDAAEKAYQRDAEASLLNEERKREDILKANERKRQDAQLELERKIQDIYVETQRELTARRLKYDQEFADLQEAEKRKSEELQRQHDARMLELGLQYDERVAEIGRKMDEELEVINKKQEAITKALEKAIDTISQYSVEELQALGDFSEEQAAKILEDLALIQLRINNIAATYRTFRGIGGQIHEGQGPPAPPPRRRPGYGDSPIRGYARGGRPPTNEPFMVGEPLAGNKPNPEIISTPSAMNVTPLSDFLERMYMRNMVPGGGGGDTHVYHKTLQAEVMVHDPTKFTEQQVGQLKAIIGEVLKGAMEGVI